jgi:hypothetical protein
MHSLTIQLHRRGKTSQGWLVTLWRGPTRLASVLVLYSTSTRTWYQQLSALSEHWTAALRLAQQLTDELRRQVPTASQLPDVYTRAQLRLRELGYEFLG